MTDLNLHLMAPEIVLVLLGLLLILADLSMKREVRHRLGWVAATVFGAVSLYLILTPTPEKVELAVQGLFRVDGFSHFMKIVFGLCGTIVAIMSVGYMKREGRGAGEYFSIVTFALFGMFLVSSVNDLMSMFVSLELVTLSFFILAAFRRQSKLSGKAGIKYIIIGALAAAIMLFGMAFIYGATGEVRFTAIAAKISEFSLSAPDAAAATFGIVLLLVGLGFKVASVPFHVWVPDVYQGAPTPVTAFLSVGSKAAGFVLIIRVLTMALPDGPAGSYANDLFLTLRSLFALLAGLTLIYGNLAAIPQVNIKRLMGYSSIGHAGYLLLGIVAIMAARMSGTSYDSAVIAICYYLFAYVFTNLAVFLGVVTFSAFGGRRHQIDDYAGLSKRAPLMAFCMTIALLSLAGVPPLAGFFGKFYLLTAAVEAAQTPGNGWLLTLAAIGALNVVISMYYYLLVVKRMYMMEPPEDAPRIRMSGPVTVALLACVVMILLMGIVQGPFVEMARGVLATMGG